MNVMLVKAIAVLIPACMLFVGSVAFCFRDKTPSCFLQLLGAGCLVIVALSHVSEALGLFPFMHWGDEHSAGHYLDLLSALLGATLFPIGYLWRAVARTRLARQTGQPD